MFEAPTYAIALGLETMMNMVHIDLSQSLESNVRYYYNTKGERHGILKFQAS